MNRRDFFKGILAVASTAPLAMVGPGACQVLKPPHGKKKGILTVPYRLSQEAIFRLRQSWHEAVSSPSDNVIVLTDGMTFGEETEVRAGKPKALLFGYPYFDV